MNKLFKTLLTILIFSTSQIYSQITITQADFNALFPIGASENSFADTNAVSVNIGNPGGNNTWDFSGYVPDYACRSIILAPPELLLPPLFHYPMLLDISTRTFMSDDTTTITSESWSYYSTGTPSLEYGSYSENNFVTPNTQGMFLRLQLFIILHLMNMIFLLHFLKHGQEQIPQKANPLSTGFRQGLSAL
jgi:hypothetical protein